MTIFAVLAVGIIGGILAAHLLRAPGRNPASADLRVGSALSEGTKAVLQQIKGKIDLNYYSVLDLEQLPEPTKAFAERVDQLLASYEQAANGKLKVNRHTTRADAAEAFRLGIRPIATDDRNAAYLGIALTRNQLKEVLPQLSPEWEQAVEPDLTRAIQKLNETPAPPRPAAEVASETDLMSEARKLVPSIDTVTVDEGKKLLREAALEEFRAATRESQARIKEAQDQLVQAQASGSEAAQEQAFQNLRKVQAEQTERLEAIAARSEERIEAFERVKKQ